MRWLFRTDFRSFYLLNATQFLGALNDNIFKLLVIYLLIHVKGAGAANTILSLAGAIFVIPFLLFSSSAGVLADKFSKRTIIVYTKALELLIMIFGLISVFFKWEFGAYTALFLMAGQSAIFGPSKYGIIPELVQPKMVSKANGSLTSLTYLAIILGTFLASFITDVTNKNFVIEAGFCVFIAIIGLFTSFGISRTEPQRSTKKITPFFLYEIYQTLKVCWKVPHLLPCIFGSSFFLFIGAFTQLNIIPFAMQSLGLSEVGGGYLFLATAVGIAIGAVLSGQLSKDKVEPGISCIAGFFIALFFLLLYFFSWSLTATIILLALLGIVGGGYLIPFDSYLQVNSPDEKRGQVIATNNFFSFVGVLMAAFFLYVTSEELGFSAASGFAVMGVLSFFANLINLGRLSALFFPYFINKVVKRVRKLKLLSPIPDSSTLIVFQSLSWWDPLLLFSCIPRLKIIAIKPYFRGFPWINGWMDSIRIISPSQEIEETIESLIAQIKVMQEANYSVCLYFKRKPDMENMAQEFIRYLNRHRISLVVAHGKKEKTEKKFLFFRIFTRQISLHFSNE